MKGRVAEMREMADIIIFGSGEVGKNAAQFLGQHYHILFFVDNDEGKWGTVLGKYQIKSPEEVREYNCDVIIASARYGIEIADQLSGMEINGERIYFFRSFGVDGAHECDIYPLNEDKVISTGLSLVQYDLFHQPEHNAGGKRVLVLCTFFSTYAKQLIENMSKLYREIEFSILTSTEEYAAKITSGQLKHIYYFQTMADLKTILEQLPVYDAMQLLWIEREWAYFYKLIRKKATRLNLNVGGSDFYRTGKGEKDYKRKLIACADTITAETEGTVQEFRDYYGAVVKDKMGLLPFGIEVLELIDKCGEQPTDAIKQKYHIPIGKIVVTCGHNANDAHQHKGIIEAVSRLPENLKEQTVFVFPMTYPQGRETYIKEIADLLQETGLRYVILTEFMDFQEMAEYARISDIMLHVQKTDQLSSTMLEEMYAGSIVIAGKWLPYQSLHRMGMFFLDVDRLSAIAEMLEAVIEKIGDYKEKCAGNRELVRRHSSWEELAPKWRVLWE